MARIENHAAGMLDDLNRLTGGKWVMKVGADGDVLLFHKRTDT